MSVFEAIADPVRRSILLTLVDGPSRVVDLCSNLSASHPISRPAVSRHLRLLTEAGLVIAEDKGRERHYRLETAPMDEVSRFITDLTTTVDVNSVTPARSRRPPIFESDLDALDTEVRRTTRDRRRAPRQPTSTSDDKETA